MFKYKTIIHRVYYKNQERSVLIMWNKIKQELDKQGITEYRLAKMTGISPQQLHQMKKRNTKNPKWLTVVKIAEALGVSLDEFK